MFHQRLWTLALLHSFLIVLLGALTLPVYAAGADTLIVSMQMRVRGTTYRQQIYAVSADGSERVRLTQTDEDEKSPTVSPDGTKIAFVSRRDGIDQIYVMGIDGANPINVDGDPSDYFDSPVWSPDSQRLLFHSNIYHPEVKASYGELWIADANGSNRRLLRGSPQGSAIEASWSPNGGEVLFREDTPEGSAIWVMTESASDAMRLTDPAGLDYNPVWSPGGGQIAFVRNQGETGLWTMNNDGSNPIRWVPDVQARALAWSPDGQSIAYIASPRGVYEIFIAPVDSANASPAAPSPGMADLEFAWSPDGTRIAAVVNGLSPALGQLVMIDVAGQTREVIVSDTYTSGRPAWVPQPSVPAPHERAS